MPVKVSRETVIRALSAFALKQSDYRPLSVQTGYRNLVVPLEPTDPSLTPLCLIFYKNEPKILSRIKLANQLSNQLATLGWPTRRTFRNSRILVLTSTKQSHYCCLYNYLPGTTIAWEDYTLNHLKLMGQALGFLHHNFLNISQTHHNLASNECLNIQDKITEMNNYFMQDNVIQAIEQKLKLKIHLGHWQLYYPLLEWLNQHRPHQLLHLDFVRGNLLFESSTNPSAENNLCPCCYLKKSKSALRLSGILDFEKAAIGPIELELARCLAFLLVDCDRNSIASIFKTFLQSGYAKRGNHPLPNLKIIKPLIQLYLLIDFYHFLLHNPYEHLSQNHHYLHTIKLINPGLISSSQSCYK